MKANEAPAPAPVQKPQAEAVRPPEARPAAPEARPPGPAAADPKTNVAIPTAGFGQTQTQTQTRMKESMDNVMRTAEELMALGQGNVEAFVKSGQILAAGMQDLSQLLAANAQARLDETVATWKALAGVKSLKEVFELQSGLARTSVEKALADTGRLTEASLKLAEQSMAPIAARVTLTVEKFSARAA